jgi:hypothetical protein
MKEQSMRPIQEQGIGHSVDHSPTGHQRSAPPFQLAATSTAQVSQPEDKEFPLSPPTPAPAQLPVPAQPQPPARTVLGPILVRTVRNTPDRRGKNRTKVGVGEEVFFHHQFPGQWSASQGVGDTDPSSKTFRWRAPAIAGQSTIKITTQMGESSVSMDVVAPEGKRYRKTSERQWQPGIIGAGMYLDATLLPLNVSFDNLSTREMSGPPRNLRGIVNNWEGDDRPFHHAAPVDNPVINDNIASWSDEASFKIAHLPRTETGAFEFNIPNGYRVRGDTAPLKHYCDVVQYTQLDTERRVTVSKGSESVTRKP